MVQGTICRTSGINIPQSALTGIQPPLGKGAKKHILHKKHEKMCIFIGKTPCNPGKRML